MSKKLILATSASLATEKLNIKNFSSLGNVDQVDLTQNKKSPIQNRDQEVGGSETVQQE